MSSYRFFDWVVHIEDNNPEEFIVVVKSLQRICTKKFILPSGKPLTESIKK